MLTSKFAYGPTLKPKAKPAPTHTASFYFKGEPEAPFGPDAVITDGPDGWKHVVMPCQSLGEAAAWSNRHLPLDRFMVQIEQEV